MGHAVNHAALLLRVVSERAAIQHQSSVAESASAVTARKFIAITSRLAHFQLSTYKSMANGDHLGIGANVRQVAVEVFGSDKESATIQLHCKSINIQTRSRNY